MPSYCLSLFHMRRTKLILVVIIFIAIILFIISSTREATYRLSNYYVPAQAAYLKPIQTFQISHAERPTMEKVLDYLKNMQTQMSDFNNTIRNLKEWSDYQSYRRKIADIVYDTYNPKEIRKTNPHVLLHDVDIDCNVNYKVIILVTSFAKNFERRNTIRTLWGNNSKWSNIAHWKVVFNVGTVENDPEVTYRGIAKESSTYKDMFMVDTKENFYLLSKKVMIALHWVYQSFKFDFILKIDDDIFVHVDRLIKLLSGEWRHGHYIGHRMRSQPVERKGRYRVSMKEWPNRLYDPYCSGGGYILSQEITGRMIPYFNWDSPLKIDDAYIGHLVKLGGGAPMHVPESFQMWNDKCLYLPNIVVSHPGKIECQKSLMEESLNEMDWENSYQIDKNSILVEKTNSQEEMAKSAEENTKSTEEKTISQYEKTESQEEKIKSQEENSMPQVENAKSKVDRSSITLKRQNTKSMSKIVKTLNSNGI